MRKNHNILAAVVLLILILLGCNSSRITSSWKVADRPVRQYGKILVLGLVRSADRSLRERMEAHLVDDLRENGQQAISATSTYGPKAFEGKSEKEAMEQLRGDAIDAVMTIVLLDRTKERIYVPGQVTVRQRVMHNGHFWGYYRNVYDRIQEPGYYMTETSWFWESNLYDMASDRLMYSVQSRSIEPGTAESLAHEYGRLIVKDMMKEQVLRRP